VAENRQCEVISRKPYDATTAVRDLNDRFRATFFDGVVLMTRGVNALDADVKRRLLVRVRTFDAFTPENDPFEEHDFGSIDVDGEWFFFKIDYFDPLLEGHSENAADPWVTTRVLTIMRADEY
jgi:hypothetical protein